MSELARQVQIAASGSAGVSAEYQRFCWSHYVKEGQQPVAAYVWTSAMSGNEIALCVECCADWRARAVAEPELGPSRITLLESQHRSDVLNYEHFDCCGQGMVPR